MENYLDGSIYLPYLNNEKDHINKEIFKDRFLHLNSFMMAQNLDDGILHPRASS